MTHITDEQIEEMRAKFERRFMTSAIDEYCPEEFGELLDEIQRLRQSTSPEGGVSSALREALVETATVLQLLVEQEDLPDTDAVSALVRRADFALGKVKAALSPQEAAPERSAEEIEWLESEVGKEAWPVAPEGQAPDPIKPDSGAMVERVVSGIVRDVAELPGDDYTEGEAMCVSADELRVIVERNISNLVDERRQLSCALDLQIENENALVAHNRALALEACHYAELVEAARSAKRLIDNINEFGNVTDIEFVDEASSKVGSALALIGGAE